MDYLLNGFLDLVDFGNLDGGLDHFLDDVLTRDDIVDDSVNGYDLLDQSWNLFELFLDNHAVLWHTDDLLVDHNVIDDFLHLMNLWFLHLDLDNLLDQLRHLNNILPHFVDRYHLFHYGFN